MFLWRIRCSFANWSSALWSCLAKSSSASFDFFNHLIASVINSFNSSHLSCFKCQNLCQISYLSVSVNEKEFFSQWFFSTFYHMWYCCRRILSLRHLWEVHRHMWVPWRHLWPLVICDNPHVATCCRRIISLRHLWQVSRSSTQDTSPKVSGMCLTSEPCGKRGHGVSLPTSYT